MDYDLHEVYGDRKVGIQNRKKLRILSVVQKKAIFKFSVCAVLAGLILYSVVSYVEKSAYRVCVHGLCNVIIK